MNNVSKGLVGVLFATAATVSSAKDCLAEQESLFGTREANINACVNDGIKGLSSTSGKTHTYFLEDAKQLRIGDKSSGKFVGEIDLNWDTVQVDPSENDIPFSQLSKKAQGFYSGALKEACAGFKGNLSGTAPKIAMDIEKFAKISGVSGDTITGLKKELTVKRAEITDVIANHCDR